MNNQKLIKSIIQSGSIKDMVFQDFFQNHKNIKFSEPIILHAKHAYDVYYHRYMLQKNITKARVIGYEILLENLKNQTNNIHIYQIKTQIGFIACFFNDFEQLLGVLWNPDKR